MNNLPGFTFIVVAIVFLCNLHVIFAEKTCKDVLSDLTKRQLGGISTCTKTMGFKNGKEKAAKQNCIMKCVMANEGFLAADGGLLDDPSLKAFIDRIFPAFMVDKTFDIFAGCARANRELVDPKEEFCKSYDGFIKCLTGSIGKLCA